MKKQIELSDLIAACIIWILVIIIMGWLLKDTSKSISLFIGGVGAMINLYFIWGEKIQ